MLLQRYARQWPILAQNGVMTGFGAEMLDCKNPMAPEGHQG